MLATRFVSALDGVALARAAVAQLPPLEQHLDPCLRISTDNGVEIVVPSLYHEVITARLRAATVDNYGERYAAGPRLHFVSFTATSSLFGQVRRAMDGHYPNGGNPGSTTRTTRSSASAAFGARRTARTSSFRRGQPNGIRE